MTQPSPGEPGTEGYQAPGGDAPAAPPDSSWRQPGGSAPQQWGQAHLGPSGDGARQTWASARPDSTQPGHPGNTISPSGGGPTHGTYPAPTGHPQPGHPQPGHPQPGHSQWGGQQPGSPAGDPRVSAAHPWVPAQIAPTPSELPVVPRQYHEFLRTPRMRWWRPLAALGMAAALWLLVTVVLSAVAVGYDLASGTTTPESYGSIDTLQTTPALFLANNLSLAACIPITMLTQWACFGQRPRWLSSVAGRFRWNWFAQCVLWVLPWFLLSLALDVILGGLPELRVSAATWFMIVVILLTTPLQAAGEEYLLRGLGQRIFGAWLPRTAGLVVGTAVTAAIFMSLHGAGDPWLNVFYVLFAVAGSLITWRTGGLEATIALHVVNNVVAMAFLPFVDFSDMFNRADGTGSPVLLVQMVIMGGAVAVLAWRARVRGVLTEAAPGAAGPGPQPMPAGAPIVYGLAHRPEGAGSWPPPSAPGHVPPRPSSVAPPDLGSNDGPSTH